MLFSKNLKLFINTFKKDFKSLNKKFNSTIKSGLNKIIPNGKDGSLALVSLSNDIHYNLAFENYLAESVDLKNRNILLLWISEPCIVFGRHQNPWLEINVKEADTRSVKVVRRYSGGGCVYHDKGNLNISFITDRLRYDRKHNLTIIKNTLDSLNFDNVLFEVTPRHDIFVKNLTNVEQSFKISGSAARLAQKFSYHHCTLLFDADINNMKLLKSNLSDRIITKATTSVRSNCINLKNLLNNNQNLDLKQVIIKLCEQYWRINSSSWSSEFLFNYVNPEEDDLSALFEKNLNELKSWDYTYGSTPKFQLKIDLANNTKLNFTISNGLVKEFEIENQNDLQDYSQFKQGLNTLINSKLDNKILTNLILENNLIDLNPNFKHLFEFFNKNF